MVRRITIVGPLVAVTTLLATGAVVTLLAAGAAGAQPSAQLSARPSAQSSALDSLLAGPDLDLGLLERAVLERNPSLAAMRAGWRASEAAADQAGALEDPMLDLSTAPQSWNSSAVDRAYMVGISQPFPIFGQRGLMKRGARAGARAMGEDYRGARLDLLREARRSYYENYLLARSQAVNAELTELLEQFRRVAVTKYSTGTVGLEDALQADVELGMLAHQEVVLKRGRRVVEAQLNAFLQREPTGPLPPPPVLLPVEQAPESGDSLRRAALDLRPEIKNWAAQGEEREAMLALAKRRRLPDLAFTARYDRFMNEREWRSQVGLSLNLPIQLGRLGAAVREARAGVEQVEYRRRAAEIQVAYEVEVALTQVQETGHELHILEESVLPATERALQAIRAGYENNRSDFLTLLSAERDLARARLELYQAQVGYLQAVADLDRAVGTAPPEGSQEVK